MSRRIPGPHPAQLDRDHWYSCLSKTRYRSKAHAIKQAKRARKKGENIQAYECDNCGAWHIGHVKP